ncbi:cation:proton antiporter [Hoylesella marshii]|nr:cation:proton antiporter [Hoylesella marshii]
MSGLPELIKDLALILVVAGVVTVLFKKLKQPLVLGYIVAGFLVSPHMPYIPSIIDKTDIQTWADIGVIFLLFSMGLDFSFKKITKLGMAPFIAVTLIFISMFTLGYVAGHFFSWTHMECVFLAAVFAVCSSTTIIYKTFTDLKLKQQNFTNLVLSVLVLEDVISIIVMVMLSAIAGGDSVNGEQLAGIVTKIVFFIVLWFVVGIFFVPLLLRKIRGLLTNEILLIVSLALCFFMAILSSLVGFSSAFGAFVIGSILAETVEGTHIIKVVDPIKDLFGAVFFVSVGMLVNLHIIIEYAVPIVVIVSLIVVGQALFGTMAFLLSGQSLKTAMRCSFSMAQIGEFPFIIASLGLSLGVIGEFMYPVIVAGSAITTFLTPYIIKSAIPAYNILERHLPAEWIKTFNRTTMIGSDANVDNKWRPLLIAMVRHTLIYSILTAATIALALIFLLPFLRELLPHWWANGLCGALALLVIAPFLRAIVAKKNHSEEFKALWNDNRRNRLPLLLTIFIRATLAAAAIFYLLQYLSPLSTLLHIVASLVVLAMMLPSRGLKRRSIRLERLFMQNLRSKDIEAAVMGRNKPLYADHLLDRDVHISDLEVPDDSTWAGKTLRELNLRRLFGVHVSSILRGSRRLNIPNGTTVIYPTDKLQVIGSDEQLTALSNAMAEAVYPADPDIEKREMHLAQLLIAPHHPLIGKTLSESGIRDRYNCMVVGLEEGKQNLTPLDPTRRFAEGDVLWLVGEAEALRTLLAR